MTSEAQRVKRISELAAEASEAATLLMELEVDNVVAQARRWSVTGEGVRQFKAGWYCGYAMAMTSIGKKHPATMAVVTKLLALPETNVVSTEAGSAGS